MHDFISCIGHLKNIGLLSYEDLPLNNTFHFTTLEKITFINVTNDLIRKGFMYQEAIKLKVCIQIFQNFSFLHES